MGFSSARLAVGGPVAGDREVADSFERGTGSSLAAAALLLGALFGWLPLAAAGGSLVAVGLAGVLAFYVTEMIRRVVMNASLVASFAVRFFISGNHA